MRFLFWLIAIWLLYRLITELVLPLFDSAKKNRQQVDQFKNTQEGSLRQQPKNTAVEKEYIDFEEIKS